METESNEAEVPAKEAPVDAELKNQIAECGNRLLQRNRITRHFRKHTQKTQQKNKETVRLQSKMMPCRKHMKIFAARTCFQRGFPMR